MCLVEFMIWIQIYDPPGSRFMIPPEWCTRQNFEIKFFTEVYDEVEGMG